jgi:hypothetical protein
VDYDKYLARWTEAMQPHVPEPLLAVGSLNRAGQTMAGMVGLGSGAAWTVLNHQARKKSAGLPRQMLVGLTANALYVWKFRTGGIGKVKVKGDPEMVLDRRAFQVTVESDGLANHIHLWFHDGQKLELEANTTFGAAALNDPLLRALTAPVAPG